MDSASLWELAQESAQQIAVFAAELAAKESQDLQSHPSRMTLVKNLGDLAVNLQPLSSGSEMQQSGAQDAEQMSKRLETVLQGLELLCTWHEAHRKPLWARFPTLHALLSMDLGSRDVEGISRLEKSLKAFASDDPKRVKRFYSFLNSFSSSKDQLKNQIEAPMAGAAARSVGIVDVPDDYPGHVHETFYTVMKKFAQCCCPVPANGPSRHDARLLLRDNFMASKDDILFDVVFSRVPPETSCNEVEWQQLQFHIPRKQMGLKRVAFAIAVNEMPPRLPTGPNTKCHYLGTIDSPEKFCELIRRRVGPVKLPLRVRDQGLLEFPNPEEVDDDIAYEQSIPLAQVLEDHDLVSKRKLILAYILAKSVWQFYNSAWMRVMWTIRSIHLFRQRSDDDDHIDENSIASVLTENPYFAFPWHNDESSVSEYLPTEYVLHRYPRVLALGIILCEIGRKKRHTGKAAPTNDDHMSLEERINVSLSNTSRLLRRKDWPDFDLQKEARHTYRSIVSSCLNPRLFEKMPSESPTEGAGAFTVEDRRAVLYSTVVYPLKTLLQKLGWVDPSGNINPQDDEASSDVQMPIDLPNQATFLDVSETFKKHETGSKARQWLLNVQKSDVTQTVFDRFNMNQSLRRIRIAVLDTGYDPAAIFFQDKQRKRRIREWKDCATPISLMAQDCDGHGTHVLSLVMKMAPTADVYVARVARSTEHLESSASNVAEAITWAAKDCGADIISMSFGFDEDVLVNGEPIISNAISDALRAKNQRLLLFAAAANDGGNSPEMFPARHPQVLSIRGTDDKGWLRSFNPPVDSAGCKSFMTLGQDVPGASLSKDDEAETCKSGTSASTPIAAGIAAIMLGYARVYEEELKRFLGDEKEQKSSELWTISGMCKVFRLLSTEMMDRGLYLSMDGFVKLRHKGRLSLFRSRVAMSVKISDI